MTEEELALLEALADAMSEGNQEVIDRVLTEYYELCGLQASGIMTKEQYGKFMNVEYLLVMTGEIDPPEVMH